MSTAILRFAQPHTVTDVEIAFGGRTDQLLPAENEIPREYWMRSNAWVKTVSRWFFKGATVAEVDALTPKAGVDKTAALRHLRAVLGSWEPKHEHKESGCAYLASLWFEAVP